MPWSFTVTVNHKNIVHDLSLLVVAGDGTRRLGKNWFASLDIGVASKHQASTGPVALRPLLDKYPSVFSANLTGCTDLPAHLELLEGATTKFLKDRPV